MALEGVLGKLRESRVGGAIKSRTADSFFWLCVLAGVTPALMSNLISPIEWVRAVLAWPIVFPHVDDYMRLAALVLLVAGAAIAIARERYWQIAMLLPLAFYAFANNDTASPIYLPTQVAYNVASFFTLIAFILSGSSRLRSLYFVGYLAALIVVSLVEPLIWGYQIIVFLGFVVVARIAALFIKENVDTFREMGLVRVAKVAGIALLMWLPILGFILPGQLLTGWLRSVSEDYIYSVEPLSLLNKQRDPNTGEPATPRELRSDINAALEITAQIKQVEIDNGLAALGGLTEETRAQAPDIGTNTARAALPGDPLIALPSCGFFDILCWIERAIKSGINRGYSGIRERALANIHAELTAMANDKARSAQEVITVAQQRVVSTVQAVKSGLQTAALYAFMTFDALNVILNLLLVLAAVKSYLYVFARYAFKPGERGIVTLSTPDTPGRVGVAVFHGQEYVIPARNKTNWFYSTRFEVEGRPGKFAVPQWRSAVLPRLLNWNYFMNVAQFGGRRGEADGTSYGQVKLKTSGEMHLVEWQFHGDEEIIFHLDDFVGMTEDVKISSIVSFRLSTLLLGRIIFHQAKGPGKLLLRVRGEPTITGAVGNDLNRPSQLHVAWNRQAEFTVFAFRDIVNIYLRGVNLSSRPGDVVVVEAGTGNAKARGGIARFIKSFLLPV